MRIEEFRYRRRLETHQQKLEKVIPRQWNNSDETSPPNIQIPPRIIFPAKFETHFWSHPLYVHSDDETYADHDDDGYDVYDDHDEFAARIGCTLQPIE